MSLIRLITERAHIHITSIAVSCYNCYILLLMLLIVYLIVHILESVKSVTILVYESALNFCDKPDLVMIYYPFY